ncbi:MAG: hypothetical protein IJJ45_01730 [Clostridia bacterium]|nr:hypothetical protein [Clostridia bacterium]
MEHLTYEDYAGMGGAASEAVFCRLEARANRIVDTLTHGRLADETPLRSTVKYCLAALIDAFAADAAIDAGTGREVAAVRNDGVSVTYAGASSDPGGSTSGRTARIVREWLSGETTAAGVSLLYAGVGI